jgi:hypothetical protein
MAGGDIPPAAVRGGRSAHPRMSFAAAVEHYGRAELLDGFRVWANDPGRNAIVATHRDEMLLDRMPLQG